MSPCPTVAALPSRTTRASASCPCSTSCAGIVTDHRYEPVAAPGNSYHVGLNLWQPWRRPFTHTEHVELVKVVTDDTGLGATYTYEVRPRPESS